MPPLGGQNCGKESQCSERWALRFLCVAKRQAGFFSPFSFSPSAHESHRFFFALQRKRPRQLCVSEALIDYGVSMIISVSFPRLQQ